MGEDRIWREAQGMSLFPSTFLYLREEKSQRAQRKAYEYSRTGIRPGSSLKRGWQLLEDASFGLAFASGMAAESTLAITLLHTGDHVLAFDDLYGGTRRLFNRILDPHFKVEVTYADARDLRRTKEAIRSNHPADLAGIHRPTL